MPGGGSLSLAVQQGNLLDLGQQQERKRSKDPIHSGHFMVSDFEAEARDDDDEVAIPVPEDSEDPNGAPVVIGGVNPAGDLAGGSPGDLVPRPKKSDTSSPGKKVPCFPILICSFLFFFYITGLPVVVQSFAPEEITPALDLADSFAPAVTIDQSLTKLFQCMTLAYRFYILLI